MSLSFASAPEIVRAYQKDTYINVELQGKVRELAQWLKGVRFVNGWSSEIESLTSAMYLCLTTLVDSRTLGEEYTDLFFVTADQQLPSRLRKLIFILLTTAGPHLVKKILKVQKSWLFGDMIEPGGSFSGLSPSTLASLHLALFYLSGAYYQLSNRLSGLRYVVSHHVEQDNNKRSYEFLGILIVARCLGKILQAHLETPSASTQLNEPTQMLSLEDSSLYPYIPEAARQCSLCFETIQAPTVTLCGHLFCWGCVSEWCRDNHECPLCRQACEEQNLLLLQP